MKLPELFLQNMKELLGNNEFDELITALGQERFFGLKVNTLKISVEEFIKIFNFSKTPVPWGKDGFYFSMFDNPTHNPLYNLGIYYIQEPSAMLPASILAPKPGERVLDLCASPGGKTVQLACSMQNTGLLVSNDISEKRIKPLVKNVEFYGLENCVVTNESPQNLSNRFEKFFDKILVDAPCSGEGMFKKDKEAVKNYAKYSSLVCTKMQNDILHYANVMLKENGIIVYSTCTFNPDENERMIYDFSKKYGYDFLDIPKQNGLESGRSQWCNDDIEIAKTARIWPHKANGEGHFVAMLQKNESNRDCLLQKDMKQMKCNAANDKIDITNAKIDAKNPKTDFKNIRIDFKNPKTDFKNPKTDFKNPNIRSLKCNPQKECEVETLEEILNSYRCFEEQNLVIKLMGHFFRKDSFLYLLPDIKPDFDSLKVAKCGLFLGEYGNGKFDPSHSFVISLKKKDIKHTISIDKDSVLLEKYLKGETLVLENTQIKTSYEGDRIGLVALCVDDFVVGWGKISENIFKNLYPKGWRK